MFQAEVALALCDGSARGTERRFGRAREAVETGLNELRSGIRCVENFVAKGRVPVEQLRPQLAADIRDLVEPRTHTDPELKSDRRYTDLAAREAGAVEVTPQVRHPHPPPNSPRRVGLHAPDAQAQLQALGVQAVPRPVSHDEVVRAAVRANGVTTLAGCASAFVAGLANDLAALRAPLRAFAVVAHFPDHLPTDPKGCRICGYNTRLLSDEYRAADSLSALPTAGIHGRVDDAYAAAQTLDWFATLPPVVPTREQVGRFEEVLDVIARASAKATCNSRLKDLSSTLGGDKYHRLYVIETLGYCGVLHTELGEPLLDQWVNRRTIQEHPSKFNEAEAPACFWKWEFGFNGARFRELFSGVALPAAP